LCFIVSFANTLDETDGSFFSLAEEYISTKPTMSVFLKAFEKSLKRGLFFTELHRILPSW